MEILLVYIMLVIISTVLMVLDWTNEGLDVSFENLMVFILLSTFGCIIVVPMLGIKYILHKIGIRSTVLFKGKK